MAIWAKPREIALIYDENGELIEITVDRIIMTEDGFEVPRGRKAYPVEELPERYERWAENVLLDAIDALNHDTVE